MRLSLTAIILVLFCCLCDNVVAQSPPPLDEPLIRDDEGRGSDADPAETSESETGPPSSEPEPMEAESQDQGETEEEPQPEILEEPVAEAVSQSEAPEVQERMEAPESGDVPQSPADVELPDLRPFGKGDMELSIGFGGFGYGDGFSFQAGAVFAYYVVQRLAPGMDINYQATWGDFKYPQSLTIFPFLKFILVRSKVFAPYLLTGVGRTFEWGGTERGLNEETGSFAGYAPVSSWMIGNGGGVFIGIGRRAGISLQLLAVYRHFDDPVLRDAKVVVEQAIVNGAIVSTYALKGDRTDHIWYPAPSFWFSLRF